MELGNRGKKCIKALRRGFALILASAVIATSVPTAVSAETSALIKEKQSQISSIEKEKKELQAGLTDVKKIRQQLASAKSNLQSYVQELDANLMELQDKIDNLKNSIIMKEIEIKATEQELEAAKQTQVNQYEAMKKRIQFMYEEGDEKFLQMMLESGSINDALNRYDYIQALSAYDANKLQEYVEITDYVQACKEQLDAEKELLEQTKAAVEEEEAAVAELISDKEIEIQNYSNNIAEQDAAIKEYEAEIAEQNALITELEKAIEEEKKRLAAQNKAARTYDGGMFTWPAPSYTRISDDYGERIHPITKKRNFHNGVDMAAPSGSPILAAYDGEVAAAAYHKSMGNYIMIDHGDGLYTIYMHASKLYVNKGDIVVAGQQIAAVGSTGNSTGPHLHFTVRLNGEYQNPWKYLKG